MQVPMETSYRGVDSTLQLEELIRTHVDKLERLCDQLISCRIAVERDGDHLDSGNPYRVRIEVTMPPHQDLVVDRSPRRREPETHLHDVVVDAFHKMERRIRDEVQKKRWNIKTHSGSDVGLVVRINREDGFGFLRGLDGQEVYFHENSVLHKDFSRLSVGTQVAYVVEDGDEGPQASTVRIVDKPGERISDEGGRPETAYGWRA